ncbi:hypothetical protein [Mesorhizobium prunaredense]|uniref:hypothetical protein n=1 Tax=Mesorhizobium prunaredense TaxID=1631249 RepID=UPI001180E850|nr:hypothetical protein [Mesorhizobium prunaredense]
MALLVFTSFNAVAVLRWQQLSGIRTVRLRSLIGPGAFSPHRIFQLLSPTPLVAVRDWQMVTALAINAVCCISIILLGFISAVSIGATAD